jgi:N-acetylneuraminate synthase
MYGSDHPSSFEPEGVMKLRKYIDGVEQAMGDGVKQVYESEIPIKEKLRR